MASIVSFGSLDVTSVNDAAFGTHLSHSPGSYVWTTPSTAKINLLSGIENIAVNATNTPVSGTINGIVSLNSLGSINYTVTGLAAPITSLFALDPAASHESYWETVLAGATDFTAGPDGDIAMAGDFIRVGLAQTATGAADRFDVTRGFAFLVTQLTGDALAVDTGSTLNGGNDIFNVVENATSSPQIFGDAETHAGRVNGGADTITVSGALSGAFIMGDARDSDGILIGGADILNITTSSSSNATTGSFSGDNDENRGDTTGGNDKINFTGTGNTFDPALLNISGDSISLAAGAFLRGGADAITISNATARMIAGDAINVGQAGATVIGGNDVIVVNSPFAVTVAGDIFDFTAGTLTPGGDRITGGSGDDRLFGEEASNPTFPGSFGTIVNAGGNDILGGRDGNDTLLGQVGNDIIDGGAGNDVINGGSGADLASFVAIAAAVIVDLEGIDGTSTGGSDGELEAIGQGLDHILLVERVRGSQLGDTIKGDNQSNFFLGMDGDDIMLGRAGNDRLTGGNGKDTLVGGTGTDIFDFDAVAEMSASAATADVISDFTAGDKIDLSTIDANGAIAGDPFFVFKTTALTGAGQVNFIQSGGNTLIQGSTDADAAAEFIIVLTGLKTLAATDFIL
jgi:Ca2+-binding RTX toxin-like protein